MLLYKLIETIDEAISFLMPSSAFDVIVLSALVALFASLFSLHTQEETTKFGTVNVTEIVEQFIKQERSKNVSQEVLKKEVGQFGIALDKEIRAFSKLNHVTLFLREAVVANAHDYTNEVKKQMAHHMDKEGQ